MSQTPSDFFDTDGRPEPASDGERKLNGWAVLHAVGQGLMSAAEARAAYSISAEEMEAHRADWLGFEAGR